MKFTMPRLRSSTTEVAVPYFLVFIAVTLAGILIPGFLSGDHVRALAASAAYIGIIAIGQTIVILLGGIDLSVPYTVTFAAVVMTQLEASGWEDGLSLVVALALGVGIGLVNGVIIVFLKINALVVTLGMNSILLGAVLLYTGGSPKGYASELSVSLSTGLFLGIPIVVYFWLALAVLVTVVLRATTFGRGVYSVGSNQRASIIAAMPVKSVTVGAYVVSGLSAAFGGVLLAGYTGQAYLGMGDSYLLSSIAVVVIGGTSIFGGRGSYIQTVAGAMFIVVLSSVLVTMNVGAAAQQILYGVIILLMMFLNHLVVSRGHGGGRKALKSEDELADGPAVMAAG